MKPQVAPIALERINICEKEFVNRRAIVGGITSAAAINVTPSTCIETRIEIAKTTISSASMWLVRKPEFASCH